MANLREIAEKLGKKCGDFTDVPVVEHRGIAIETLLQYPTATLVCFAAGCAVVAAAAILSIVAFLCAASV